MDLDIDTFGQDGPKSLPKDTFMDVDASSTPSTKLIPPTILQDDLPIDPTEELTSTAMSVDSVSYHHYITDTLSSISSGHETLITGFSINGHHSSQNLNGSNNSSNNALSTGSSTASFSSSRRSSMQFSSKFIEVRETLDASLTHNEDGYRQLGQYILKNEIGKGAFGKVHLASNTDDGKDYAVKEFSKSKLRKKDKANLFKLGPRGRGRGRGRPAQDAAPAPSFGGESSSPLDLIRGEVAILKKLHHPNIVKLYEVLDVAQEDSMYMVFEWCEKGVLMPVSLTETYEPTFSDEECRDVFQQMVLGIEYLHEHDIVHKDIKPDNLLRSSDGTVKIVDFGVSEMFDKKGSDMTKKSAGSPAFMAPEQCRADHGEFSGRASDVWSMGVTLFCLRYGRLPFISTSILDMQRAIRDDGFIVPETESDERFQTLIHQLLEKDPSKRITVEQLRDDPWLTNNGEEPLLSKEENTATVVTEVTEEDLRSAFQKISSLAAVIRAVTLLKRGIKKSPVPSEKERMQDAIEPNEAEAEKAAGLPNIAQIALAAASAGLNPLEPQVNISPEAVEPKEVIDQGSHVEQLEIPEAVTTSSTSLPSSLSSPPTFQISAPEEVELLPSLSIPEPRVVLSISTSPISPKSVDMTRASSSATEPESAGVNHSPTSSTGSSSGASMTAPRIIGRLSRDRLAMFERS